MPVIAARRLSVWKTAVIIGVQGKAAQSDLPQAAGTLSLPGPLPRLAQSGQQQGEQQRNDRLICK